MRKVRIGVLTEGADCAGSNPAVKWVVNSALDEQMAGSRVVPQEVLGIRDGFPGLVNIDPSNPDGEDRILLLDEDIVRSWDRYGGDMLGSPQGSPPDPGSDQSRSMVANIERLGLEALIVIGGESALSTACALSRAGVNVIGIPASNDKSIPDTDYSLGFDTALNLMTGEVDKLRTIAGSQKRIFIVETSGRKAGWLALEGGDACGASITLIPEHDFSFDKLNELVMRGVVKGARYQIILAAEGAKPVGWKDILEKEMARSSGQEAQRRVVEIAANEIGRATRLEARGIVISHLLHGGCPSARDRRMGRLFGIAAINLVSKRHFGKMVCCKEGRIATCSLGEVVGKRQLIDVKTQYDVQRYTGCRSILDPNDTERGYTRTILRSPKPGVAIG